MTPSLKQARSRLLFVLARKTQLFPLIRRIYPPSDDFDGFAYMCPPASGSIQPLSKPNGQVFYEDWLKNNRG